MKRHFISIICLRSRKIKPFIYSCNPIRFNGSLVFVFLLKYRCIYFRESTYLINSYLLTQIMRALFQANNILYRRFILNFSTEKINQSNILIDIYEYDLFIILHLIFFFVRTNSMLALILYCRIDWFND